MAITTYSQLQTAVANWVNRADLTALVPDFITLAEERINRELRTRQMESPLVSTSITDNRIAVASNIVGVHTLWVVGYESTPLESRPYESILSRGTDGTPTGWAWLGGHLYFDGTGDVEGVVYEAVPALSDSNTTNWLLTAYPSLYLAGAMTEASIYVRDQRGVDLWNGRFTGTLDGIQGADMRDRFSGPIAVSAR